jgi:hypothetical protein
LQRLAFFLERREPRDVDAEATPRQLRGHCAQVGAQQFRIEHGEILERENRLL